MVILDNGILHVEIAEIGAEIRRVTKDGEERFYDGNPDFWTGVAPILFPVCGGLKDCKYTFGGETYEIEKHGFARHSLFEVEWATATEAVFSLKESEETLKAFPWSFEFRVKYTLSGSSIRVEYDIFNTDSKTMYVSVGAHEAYACPEGVEDYDIIFEKKETLNAHRLSDCGISRQRDIMLKDSDTLPLYDKYFEIDALIFTDHKSRFVTLRNRKTGKETSVSFPDCNYLLIWTKPSAPYVCIEPWAGFPSYTDEDYDITKKEGMNKLDSGAHYINTHTVYLK